MLGRAWHCNRADRDFPRQRKVGVGLASKENAKMAQKVNI